MKTRLSRSSISVGSRRLPRLAATAILVACGVSAPAWAQWSQLDEKPLPLPWDADNRAGYAYAVSGDVAVIGADWDRPEGDFRQNWGSAQVYRFSAATQSWTPEALLAPDDARPYLRFGMSAAASRDMVVIGAHDSAYVFRFDSATGAWRQEAKLRPSSGDGRGFGTSVSAFDDVIVVGAFLDDDDFPDAGAAYVFRRDAGAGVWRQEARLTAEDERERGWFGYRVSVFAHIAVVGALPYANGQPPSGSVYVFRRDQASGAWELQAKLLEGELISYYSLSIWGNTLLVGAPNDNELGWRAGAAYTYLGYDDGRRWEREAKLLADDGAEHDRFGHSVALGANVAVIGSVWDDTTGSAYMFQRHPATAAWRQEAKLLAADAADGDCVGHSVAVSNDVVLVGAEEQTYVFGRCVGDADSDAEVNLTDLALLLANFGASDAVAAEGDFDGDRIVDLVDLEILLSRFGQACEPWMGG